MHKEFKIAVVKKLSTLEENSERQFSGPRNKTNEQEEYFTKFKKRIRQKFWS